MAKLKDGDLQEIEGMHRKRVFPDKIDVAFDLVKRKLLSRLDRKGLHGYASSHECLGIITEEFEELVVAVRSNKKKAIEGELVDLAVAAIYSIASKRADCWDW